MIVHSLRPIVFVQFDNMVISILNLKQENNHDKFNDEHMNEVIETQYEPKLFGTNKTEPIRSIHQYVLNTLVETIY